jgi:hypothetical protein
MSCILTRCKFEDDPAFSFSPLVAKPSIRLDWNLVCELLLPSDTCMYIFSAIFFIHQHEIDLIRNLLMTINATETLVHAFVTAWQLKYPICWSTCSDHCQVEESAKYCAARVINAVGRSNLITSAYFMRAARRSRAKRTKCNTCVWPEKMFQQKMSVRPPAHGRKQFAGFWLVEK